MLFGSVLVVAATVAGPSSGALSAPPATPAAITLTAIMSPVTAGAETGTFAGYVTGVTGEGSPTGTVTVETSSGTSICTSTIGSASGDRGYFSCSYSSATVLGPGAYGVKAHYTGGSSSTGAHLYGESTSVARTLRVIPKSVALYVTTGGTGTTCTHASPCGSLQAAVTAAQVLYGSDTAVTITVGPNTSTHTYAGPVTVTGATLASLSIVGTAGSSTTRVAGEGSLRDFTILGGTVSISGMSIDDGSAAHGGGVAVSGVGRSISLTDDTLSQDSAQYGGALYIGGGSTATTTHVTFSADSATYGGAVAEYAGSSATFTDTSFSEDTARFGGGVTNQTGAAVFVDDTFAADSATQIGGYGGAIDNMRGSATLTNVTFSGDSSKGFGGAIYNYAGTATLTFATFSTDSAPAGGAMETTGTGTTSTTASIFDASACALTTGTLSGAHDTVTTTTTCPATTGTSTSVTTLDLTPTLETTAVLSGAPATLALGPTSPAINAVPRTDCRSARFDERGAPRPGDRPGSNHATTCDAGAYELQHAAVSLVQRAPETGALIEGVPGSFTLADANRPTGSGTLIVTPTSTSVPAGVTVASTGTISVGATASVGSYTLDGSDRDALGDSGAWTFALTIVARIAEATTVALGPITSPVTVGAESQGFAGQVHGSHGPPGGTVRVKTSTGVALCSAVISAATGTTTATFSCVQSNNALLPVGTYTVSASYSGGNSATTPAYADIASTSGTQVLTVAAPARVATVPGAPTLTAATPGSGYVHVAWSAPTTGGTPITGYEVCYATTTEAVTACSMSKVLSTAALATTVVGLTNGTTYYFAVKASNANGFGPLSIARAATPAGSPASSGGATPVPPAGPLVTRVFGETADATAAAVFSRVFPSTKGVCPQTRAAVVTTTTAYADALSSQYLAQSLTTGTLLTPTGKLSPVTATTLEDEGISTVYIVGGPLAVSPAVVKEIENLTAFECGGTARSATAGKMAVTRVYGQTAYGTAEAVTKYVGVGSSLTFPVAYSTTNVTGGSGRYNDTSGIGSSAPLVSPGPTAILVDGQEFQDAQAASIVSYHTKLPLLLTPSTTLSMTAVTAIKSLGITQVILVGGPLALTNAVEAALVRDTGVAVLRIAGKDFTDTATLLARFEAAGGTAGLGWTPGHRVLVTRGNGFTDAIAGAVLDSPHNTATGAPGTVRPLLLTASPAAVGPYLTTFLKVSGHGGINGTAVKTITGLTVLGGQLAVSTAAIASMQTDLSHWA